MAFNFITCLVHGRVILDERAGRKDERIRARAPQDAWGNRFPEATPQSSQVGKSLWQNKFWQGKSSPNIISLKTMLSFGVEGTIIALNTFCELVRGIARVNLELGKVPAFVCMATMGS